MFSFLRKLNPEYVAECGHMKWFYRTLVRKIYVKILRRDNRIRLANGVWINLPKDNLCATGIFVKRPSQDWGSEQTLVKFLKKDADFFDIGSHIGYYALWASPFCRKVYAFEPDPRNLQHLYGNAKNVENVTVVERAVTEHEVDSVAFCMASESSVNSIVEESSALNNSSVKATTIDKFCRENPDIVPCAIKVDIEGYDLAAVRGARDVIKKFQPLFLIEFYEGNLNKSESLFEFCQSVNYSVFAHVKPRRNDGSYDFTKIVFRELTRENWGSNWRIMIFLVPGKLREKFLEMV